ncbi:VRR-Nuc domain protein [Streptomyces phage Madamato]|nr:VRR-Nuc domain protein [Streptomyces phage Madamato]
MRENAYQRLLIEKLKQMFPGCFILKNDPAYLQGVPDLLVLYGGRWAMLEVKASAKSPSRPNQDYYVKMLNGMSFAAFIDPSNEQEVLDALRAEFQV